MNAARGGVHGSANAPAFGPASSAAPYAAPSSTATVSSGRSSTDATISRHSPLRAPPPDTRPTSGRTPSARKQLERVAQSVRDAFEHRAHERAAVVAEREPDESAARVGIRVRRPLAREIRREQQPLASRRPRRRLGDERLERLAGRDGVAQPAQRARRGQHHAHRVPRAGNRVAEDVHARLGVGLVPLEHAEDDARRAEDDGHRAGPGHADAERPGRLVARARDLRRFVHRRQPFAGNLERVEHLVAPAAPGDVEEQRARGVRDVDRALAEELQPDVVLREQDRADARVDVGLVRAKPQELRRGEARERAVARQRDQPLEAEAPLDLRALGAGALVVPEDRRPERHVVRAERNEPVHLAGEPDRGRVESRENAFGRAHPVVRILLGPSRLRRRELVRLLLAREHLAVRVDRDRLDRGRADVDADDHALRAECRIHDLEVTAGNETGDHRAERPDAETRLHVGPPGLRVETTKDA